MRKPLSIAAALAVLLSIAAESAASKPAGKPWVEMDYGPFMSLTLEAPRPAGNLAYKAVVLPLRPDRSAAAAFDTDLLRWSAGWGGGGFIDWRNILYDGSHNTHCRAAGEQAFGTLKRPGWARPGTDSFDDPRPLPYGPMPRDWMRWRGLYRHGDRVVLSYRVGDADVLESAELVERGGSTAFARHLRIGPRKVRLVAAVSDTSGTLVELVGRGAALARDGDHVRLAVPAGEEPVEVTLLIAAGGAGGAEGLKQLAATLPARAPGWLAGLTSGGPARHEPVRTKAEPGRTRPGAPFVVDTLAVPADNPWRARVRPGGLDFFAGGRRAAVCTWDGDVWVVDGLGTGNDTGELTWTRFATGLFQPLGLVVREDVVYVLGRDQITRLHDLNADGEADWYEAFNHDAQVTEHFHEFAMDLQLGPAGDFYYMKGACHAKDGYVPQHGTMVRVAADGGSSEIVCYGFRAPNGLAVSKDGRFFTTDQQGHWTPANRVNLIEPGKFYGYNLSYLPRPKPESYEPPVVWLHPQFDRSPAQPFFVEEGRWGPLAGKMLVSSYGTGQVELVMTEVVNGRTQGGAVKLDLPAAPTGLMRGRFNPSDGHLYACGLFGWAGDRTVPGGLYRVRYTGQPLRMPVELHAVTTGVVITFTDPLDAELAADAGSHAVTRWDYRRAAEYGSPDLRPSDGRPGRETVAVESVRVSKDRRTVALRLADMRPAMQMRIEYSLEGADGAPIRGEIYSTVHATGDPAAWDKLFE